MLCSGLKRKIDMDKNLQNITNFIQQDPNISAEQKEFVLKSLKAVDEDLQILSFKLDRTEKVKRTTAILLEETIEELEQKRQAVEESNEALQKSLKDLEDAQDQLVQQEKLASLGQLTAGIAHEIKNPLNFVNNFSELSMELVEEIRHEIRDMSLEKNVSPSPEGTPMGEGGGERSEQGDVRGSETEKDPGSTNTPLNPLSRGEAGLSPGTDFILDILNDIEINLKKIHEHGSRADSIVKSMLQHSRGGDGNLEPTLLNPLIKEYVNLAFHGMRAGKNPFNVDIDLQLDKSVGEVPLIAEDFSRVILNLVNNAFDAMRSKLTEDRSPETGEKSPFEGGAGVPDGTEVGDVTSLKYDPKLTICTKSEANTVTIEVQDNGPGIPDEMKDKIMQPFFTTKKGTAGTGLGLSITNDIIKAHGGNLTVKSSLGEGSVFIVKLTA